MSLLLDALKKAALDKQHRDQLAYGRRQDEAAADTPEPAPLAPVLEPDETVFGAATNRFDDEEFLLEDYDFAETDEPVDAAASRRPAELSLVSPLPEVAPSFSLKESPELESAPAADPLLQESPLEASLRQARERDIQPDTHHIQPNPQTKEPLRVDRDSRDDRFAPEKPATVRPDSAEDLERKAALAQLLTKSQGAARRSRRRSILLLGALSLCVCAMIGLYSYYLLINHQTSAVLAPGLLTTGTAAPTDTPPESEPEPQDTHPTSTVATEASTPADTSETTTNTHYSPATQTDTGIAGGTYKAPTTPAAQTSAIETPTASASIETPTANETPTAAIEIPTARTTAAIETPTAANAKNANSNTANTTPTATATTNGTPTVAAAIETPTPASETPTSASAVANTRVNRTPTATATVTTNKTPTTTTRTPTASVANKTPTTAIHIARGEPVLTPVDAAVRAGFDAYQRGDLTLAATEYERALKLIPHHGDALLGAAAVASRRGDQQLALGYYQQRLNRAPRDEYARAGLLALASVEAPDRAMENEVGRMLREFPEAAHLHFLKGSLAALRNDWPTAQEAFFDAWRWDKTQPDYAFNLAVSLDHLQQPADALRLYRDALRMDSGPESFDRNSARQRVAQLEARLR